MKPSVKQVLKESGYSATKPRLVVFKYLHSHDNVTVSELINRNIEIDQASVYRALNIFRKLGIIHDTIVAGQKTIELSNKFKDHHHHMFCLNCERSICIIDEEIEQKLDKLAALHGFRPTSHQLGINGYCVECR